MTVSIDRLEYALYQTVKISGTNSAVILERPNAPRPELPYTGIRFLTGGSEEFDWAVYDKTANENVWYGFREMTYTVNCYGDNAMTEAMIINSRLAWPTSRDLFRSIVSGSILRKTSVLDLSLLMSESFEKRAAFDLFLLVNLEDGSSRESYGYFDKVAPVVWTNEPTDGG